MTTNLDLKYALREALQAFTQKPLADAVTALFETLGYKSAKRFKLPENTQEKFREAFDPQGRLNIQKALVAAWLSVDLLFQITDEEINEALGGQRSMFASSKVDGTIINSYLFFAIGLQEREKPYTRTELATIARELNKLFPMPVLILFRHGATISIAIIRRRLNKRDESRDVLEKVTLIKDIRLQNPLRAHIEILADFHLSELDKDFRAQNFAQLHAAWERRLGTYSLNERFYRDIANWYFAALQDKRIVYPRNVQSDEHRSIFLIRLLTRLIFCWFLQEKDLIAPEIFSRETAKALLKDFSSQAGTYYPGFLQNLFFATLNQPQEKRDFRHKNPGGRDGNRGAVNLYRYADLFHDYEALRNLLKRVPFLNGGLFECLDVVYKAEENHPNIRFDDFSEEKGNPLHLPNDLFFEDKGHEVDLSKVYDDARKRRETTRGLIDILDAYKFTIEENTPLEEEIALDPELLGKVFENLLASFNEETRTTARKATGSFYTPREIVAYMVDESLNLYLQENVPEVAADELNALFESATHDYHPSFNEQQITDLIAALDNVRVIDIACGSGAFPMGMLQRMVDLLVKLDPNNTRWKQKQLEKAERDRQRAAAMENEEFRKTALKEATARVDDIQHSFDTRHHELDFARKLYLIENCIYGVDIQPVAIQIAKLRFFITLIVDQITDRNAPNQGVRPLPNLETKLVAADSLFALPKPKEAMMSFGDYAVANLKEKLRQVRHEYFRARTPEKKADCRSDDKRLRQEIANQLQLNGWDKTAAQKLADWDPYDPNAKAPDFFEPEWMFGGLTRPVKPAPTTLRGAFSFVNEAGGQMELTPPASEANDEWRFDIVIGNPPYVKGMQIKHLKPKLKPIYDCYDGDADLFVYFYERGINLLRQNGAFAFITSNKWLRASYGKGLRGWLAKNTQIHRLIDFGDEPIFTAIAYPCIIVLTKRDGLSKSQLAEAVTVLNWQPGWDANNFAEVLAQQAFLLPQTELGQNAWQIAGKNERQMLNRLEKIGVPLAKYVNGLLYRGITTGLNEAFIIDRNTRDRLISEHQSAVELIKPVLRGKDVKRWKVDFQDLWLIFTRKGVNINKYPSIREHLSQYKNQLMPGVPGGRKPGSYEWFEIQDNIAYWQEFEKPKLYFPSITNQVNFAIDEKEFYYGNNKTNILIPMDIYFTASILNSPIIWWLARQRFQTKQGGFYEFLPNTLSQLPVPLASDKQREITNRVVSCALALAQEGKSEQARLSSFESLLNGLVYELFFPSELEAAKLPLFDLTAKIALPDLKSLPENEHLPALRAAHEDLFLGDHPIRSALFSLRGLEVVRIIEAEESNNANTNSVETPED